MTCFFRGVGKIRLEASIGEDLSPHVTIPKADSVAERSYQMVKWLAEEGNPQGNWGQFLTADGTALRWAESVVLSGTHFQHRLTVMFCVLYRTFLRTEWMEMANG